MLLLEPSITVSRERSRAGRAPDGELEARAGALWKLSTTVLGRAAASSCPSDRRHRSTVNRSSRYEGYSWSGAVKDKSSSSPAHVCSGCEWQFDGQCCRRSSHERDDAGSVPCCGSVAEPENEIRSPTFHVVPAAGVSMVAVGRSVVDRDRDWGARRRQALGVGHSQPRVVGARLGVGVRRRDRGGVAERPIPVEIPRVAQLPAFGSLEPPPSKLTVSGAVPFVGDPVAEAIGGRFAEDAILRIVPPSKSA